MSLDNIIQIAKEQQLEELDLSNDWDADDSQKLTHIPDEVFELTHLKVLKLRNNDIKEIPSQISRLINLKFLDLIDNNENIASSYQELAQLSSLVSLRLTWNVINPIPDWFSQIEQLGLHLICRKYWTSFHFKNEIPDTILELENLVFLKIRLRFSNDWIPWLKKFKELELDLSNDYRTDSSQKLTRIPDEVFELTHLKVLKLRNNDIKEIPSQISRLINLKFLDLIDNNENIASSYQELAQLSSLVSLRLTWNVINPIPDWFSQIEQLGLHLICRKYWTSFHFKNEIPDTILELENLVFLKIRLRFSNDWIPWLKKFKELELDLSNDYRTDSSQKLTRIPDEVFELTHLKVLKLRNNDIKEIPSQISRLINLKFLDLIDNNENIASSYQELAQLSSLVSLRLSWNIINPIPDWFSQIEQLGLHLICRKYWTSFHFKNEIPDTILELENLVFLKIRLRFSNDWIPWLKKFKELELDLNENRFALVSEAIIDFPDPMIAPLFGLPESIGNLSNLTWLDLSFNQLTTLPESIDKLSNLTWLNLSHNQLTTLPESITKLPKLNRLYLSGNQITILPESIDNLSNLTELDLSSNQLTTLPKSISKLSNLTELNLKKNQLNNLPKSITKLSNLTRLDLGANQLNNLPESIGNFSSLTKLNLRRNQLLILPESITKLSHLMELDLSVNQLSTLPESITKLSHLIELDLSVNRLSTLPESITNLSHLTKLYLRGNRLSNLPESITNLSHLTELDLSYNQLSSLPESITNFSSLAKLYLRGNRLSNLPESITKLSNLRKLDLKENPLKTPPIEVANKGIKAIREYFRQLKEEGTDYIYEAKLLIIGEADAGKTTLAKKIEDSSYRLRHDEKTTKGIDVIKWSFSFLDKEKKEREFKVNIWDFGGQEIYHTTHQFFLTKRSLYALVADTRNKNTDFYYWLNLVELLSDNSPLLIIKNEKDDRYIDMDENSLRGRFENLKESLATNLKDNRGLNAILDSIKYHIGKLPHVGSALPKTWKRVREALEQDPRNYISFEEYLNICQNNGFKQLKDKLQLSDYLHDLGICLHFQDSLLLQNTVILKPEWGTDAVYKVLDDKQVINNLGKFTTKDLDNIWSDEQYCFKQAELLELMMRFKLCYQIPGTQDTYIAPQLLTKTKPKYNWDETDNLIFRYTYEFMPKGIITQFIVAMHQYIDQQQYVWRSGVYLYKDETLAEVIEYYDKRELKIRLSGRFKRDLLTIITNELRKIHSSYPRLKYQQLIPCNCQQCKHSQEPYFYPFDTLRSFAKDGDKIQCQHSRKMVEASDLIDDLTPRNTPKPSDLTNNPPPNATTIQQNFYGNVGTAPGNIKDIQHSGDINMTGDRTTDNSRNLNISGGTINNTAAGSFNLGDNQGTIANNINQDNPQQPKESKLTKILGIGAAVATVIALFFNGIFNTEVRQWFDNLFDKDIPSTSQPKEL